MRTLLLAATALAPLAAHAATYVVVPPGTTPGTGQYASLQALNAAQNNAPFLRPGDTIQLPAALATCDGMEGGMWGVGTPSNPVTIRSAPGSYSVVYDGGACLRNGKAPFTINSSNILIDGLIFIGNYGGSDGNGAGIRMGVNYGLKDSNGKYPPYNLTVTNSAFINNGNGALADDCTSDTTHQSVFAPTPSATSAPCTITFDHDVFAGNGDGSGLTHNMYIDAVDQFTFTHNLSMYSFGGHLLKSRALNTDIENNRFFDGPYGFSNNDIDIPVGGNITIKGNLIEKGPGGINDGVMIAYNEENYPPSLNNSGSTVDIENNTVIDDWSAAHGPNNAWFFQDGAWWTGKNGNPATVTNDPNYPNETVTIANNHFYSTVWTQANSASTMFHWGGPKDVLGSGNTFASTGAPALDATWPVSWTLPTTTQTLSVTMNGLQLDTNTGIHNPNSTDPSTFPAAVLWWNGLPLTPAPVVVKADMGANVQQTITYQVPAITGSPNFAVASFRNTGCCFSPAVDGQTGRFLQWNSATLNGVAASPMPAGGVFDVSSNPSAVFAASGSAPPPPPPPPSSAMLLHAAGNYFETADGHAVYLTGVHTWTDMEDNSNGAGISGAPSGPFDYASFLTWMNGANLNFIRLWTWDGPDYGTGWPAAMQVGPGRYVQTSPGKFDLTQINPAFVSRVVERVTDAAAKGIYVSVMLFPSVTTNTSDPEWTSNPFNGANNVNGISASPSTLYTATSGPLWAIQTAYLDKMVAALANAPNVLLEVVNEEPDSAANRAWQQAVVSYVHAAEAKGGGLQHPVGITTPYPPMASSSDTNAWLFSSNADWISPSGSDGSSYHDGNIPAATGAKPVMLDTDHLGTQDWVWVWQSFMRAMNPENMDDLENTTPAIEAGSQNLNSGQPGVSWIRQNEGYTNTVAKLLPMEKMQPSTAISSTGYALEDPADGYYTAFSESGSAFTLDLSGSAGQTLNAQWMDLKNGTFQAAGTVAGGSKQTMTPPTTDYAVLVLTPGTAPPPPPVMPSPFTVAPGFTLFPHSDGSLTWK